MREDSDFERGGGRSGLMSGGAFSLFTRPCLCGDVRIELVGMNSGARWARRVESCRGGGEGQNTHGGIPKYLGGWGMYGDSRSVILTVDLPYFSPLANRI